MKRAARELFRFLGSVRFAILLIACTALYTSAGTLIESVSRSHRYAALWTYGHQLFNALLWGFFLNILISALRRYPFKRRHIPFLMTHWGLLMILGGLMAKSYWGTQGALSVIEGGGSQEIHIPESYALFIEWKGEGDQLERQQLDLREAIASAAVVRHPLGEKTLTVTLADYAAHSSEHLQVVPGVGYVDSLEPFLFTGIGAAPSSSSVSHFVCDQQPWQLVASHLEDPLQAFSHFYADTTTLTLTEIATNVQVWSGRVAEIIKGVDTPHGHFDATFDIASDIPTLKVKRDGPEGGTPLAIMVPLAGSEALLNAADLSTPGRGSLVADLEAQPTLQLYQTVSGLTAVAVNPYGQIAQCRLSQSQFNTLIAYDEGFGGYALHLSLPFSCRSSNRADREGKALAPLIDQLRHVDGHSIELAPPLQLLHAACQGGGSDFPEIAASFLAEWKLAGGWLAPNDYRPSKPLAAALSKLDWSLQPAGSCDAAQWASLLFSHLEPLLAHGDSPLEAFHKLQWPVPRHQSGGLLDDGKVSDRQLLEMATQQLFALGLQLPRPVDGSLSDHSPMRLLSAYFRAYGIHPDDILATPVALDEPLNIDLPLAAKQQPSTPSTLLEENLPRVVLAVDDGGSRQLVSLQYDKFAAGMKWPILNGKYRVRFQPLLQELPYRVRLRQARQINYADSGQPYSYEADLIITERAHNVETPVTISMNRVHETWDGYRFYLSNIAPADPGALKRVQIVVNGDPAKYLLTYPGAFVMCSGVLMLLWGNPFANKRRR
jgi:hypothetical protein